MKNRIEEMLQEYIVGKISTERLAEKLGVNYYVLHSALRQGCQLFEPDSSASMDRLLTYEEEKEISDKVEHEYKKEKNYLGLNWSYSDMDRVELRERILSTKLKAQLAKDLAQEQARVKMILDEIRSVGQDVDIAGKGTAGKVYETIWSITESRLKRLELSLKHLELGR
jgi:uncharacterized protein YukE